MASDPDFKAVTRRRMSWFQTMRAVAWSFLGIRKRAGYDHDVQQLNPLHVIVAGVAAALLFIVALVVTVQWVVGSGIAL